MAYFFSFKFSNLKLRKKVKNGQRKLIKNKNKNKKGKKKIQIIIYIKNLRKYIK